MQLKMRQTSKRNYCIKIEAIRTGAELEDSFALRCHDILRSGGKHFKHIWKI